MKINVVRPGDDPEGPPALLNIFAEPHERELLEEIIEAVVTIVKSKLINKEQEDA